MNNEFSVLSQFLESLGPEVSGRSCAPLSVEQLESIRLFAEGKLDVSGRSEILPAILENEKALHELVQVIEAQR